MPQLDPAMFSSQLFWLAVSLLLLYFLMLNFIFPKMTQIFKERENRISSAIKSAEQARTEAIKIENDYKSRLSHARKASAIAFAETANELAKHSKKKIEEAEKEFKTMLKNSEKEIAGFKVSANEELKEIIFQSVKFASKEFIGFEINDEKVKSLIKEGRK